MLQALNNFTIGFFLLFNAIFASDIHLAHSASCPDNRAFAGIKIWHYLQSNAGTGYTQTTEYEGTVGIQFLYNPTNMDFYIENVGNQTITKTIDASLTSPAWNCTYETAQAKVNVQISSNLWTCTDGALDMKIIEEAEATSADYHCVDGKGNVYGPFTQVYPATRLEHDVLMDYIHENMVVHPFTQGVGSYSWTLLFRETPVPDEKGRVIGPILPLLLYEK